MKTTLLILLLLVAPQVHAAHVLSAGAGWQNMGASRETTWLPAVQGSRKDVPVFVDWRWMGTTRVYWAPGARLSVTNFWSLGGGGNLLGGTLAPLGLGIHLTAPPAAERARGWFATLEIHLANVQVGGNVTPADPKDASVPDPQAHRQMLADEIATSGGVQTKGTSQHYPLGPYAHLTLSAPVHLRVWNQLTSRVGLGFFIEVNAALVEWTLVGVDAGSARPAYGYNVMAGASLVLF